MASLTNDAVLVAADLLGVQTLPVVLAVMPQQDDIHSLCAARESALSQLRSTGLVDRYDDLDSELATALRILAHPQVELAARVVSDTGVTRICVARSDSDYAVAVRTGDTLEVELAWARDGAAAAHPILAAMGTNTPAPLAIFSAPAPELAQRLDTAAQSRDFTSVLSGMGVDADDAVDFGLAMSQCHAHAEVIALAHCEGATTRAPGAVAVYDTARGRIVASPSVAADGTVWSTFLPGSQTRVAQAISALVDTLPGGGWSP